MGDVRSNHADDSINGPKVCQKIESRMVRRPETRDIAQPAGQPLPSGSSRRLTEPPSADQWGLDGNPEADPRINRLVWHRNVVEARSSRRFRNKTARMIRKLELAQSKLDLNLKGSNLTKSITPELRDVAH